MTAGGVASSSVLVFRRWLISQFENTASMNLKVNAGRWLEMNLAGTTKKPLINSH
jgi:hypothetical protein